MRNNPQPRSLVSSVTYIIVICLSGVCLLIILFTSRSLYISWNPIFRDKLLWKTYKNNYLYLFSLFTKPAFLSWPVFSRNIQHHTNHTNKAQGFILLSAALLDPPYIEWPFYSSPTHTHNSCFVTSFFPLFNFQFFTICLMLLKKVVVHFVAYR